jgi:hypothetical protein
MTLKAITAIRHPDSNRLGIATVYPSGDAAIQFRMLIPGGIVNFYFKKDFKVV